ncbi:putative polysaccharide biosynthesis protein [Ornithinibacillus halophilus]|uniref:Polysaccharide transporter, PST family n=1 Tax=Ornithinibacillus halophilus TaxID=930117 RepID=A0A1M5JJD4_9BACI|nr:polysaccharide biosynthesis protein [Ornithinibacillus halophilus]SHG40696.1 polysaccharide transporter, PST family [Ornithinibacillus halophilus]
MESNKIIKGALILTIAGLISKILSAGYRIPLQNLTGDMGFYVYQQVYPLLGIAFVFALYGFPSAISKIVAEKDKGNKNLREFYFPLLAIMLLINGTIFIFLYLNAESIAIWIGDSNLIHAYQTAAFLFLLIPFTSMLRGFFQGNNYIQPTAYSQVGEQLFRVIIIIASALVVTVQGKDIYAVGQAAGVASIIGAGIAIIILLIFVWKFHTKQNTSSLALAPVPWGYYAKTILVFGLIASLNHMILLVIQFADTFTLVPSLIEYGLSKLDSMETKGVFDRGQPLIQLGTVLGSSFALALIPSISQDKFQRDPKNVYKHVTSAVSLSFYLAIGATIGLITLFPLVNILLFQDTSGTSTLQILVLAILLCSISITGASILQGLGFMKRTAFFIVAAFFVKWVSNQLLVPIFGINGSAFATILSLFMLCFLVLWALHRKLPELKIWKKINWKAFLIASFSMFLYLIVLLGIGPDYEAISRFGLFLYVLILVFGGGMIYLILLIRFHAFSSKELAMLPFASKLQAFSKEGIHNDN